MATLYFRGDAQGVAQVIHLTPANVEVGDIFTVTINRKDLSYTAAESTVTDVCVGLARAIGAFNNDIAEFAEVSASVVYDTDGVTALYVKVTGLDDGTPFTLTTSTTNGTDFAVLVSTIQDGTPATNEIQRVRLAGPPTGGTFTLTFSGQTTGAIAYNASAATVTAALEALSNIAAGDVSTTLNATSDWSVQFIQAFAGVDVPLMTGSGSSLTGACSVSVATSTEGSSGTREVQSVTCAVSSTATYGYSFRLYQIGRNITAYGTTGWIAWNATAAAFQLALEAYFTPIGVVIASVTRTGNETDGYVFTVTYNDYADQKLLNQYTDLSGVTYIDTFTGDTITESLVTIATVTAGSSSGTNEVQVVTLIGSPTGGTFTLTFQGQTTSATAYNASAATVQTNLIALSNIGASDVVVTGSAGGPYTCTFAATLANTDLQQMTGSGASLTGAAVNVATTQAASAGNNEQESIVLQGSPSGGTFTLTFNAETTSGIAYNASAATVQAALEGLATPVPGDFSITGGPLPSTPILVEFKGAYAKTNVTEVTGSAASLTGGGTQGLTKTDVTTPTGPHHWDNAENWSSGSLPTTGDKVYVANIPTDILYGFTITDVFAELHIAASFTGKFGNKPINDNGYFEYRQQPGIVKATKVFIGEGNGSGSPFISIDASNTQTELIVFNSGSPDDTSLPAVLWKGSHSSNVVRVFKGSFGAALLVGETATIATLQIGYLTDKESDVEYAIGKGVTLTTLQISGGDGSIDLSTADASSFTMSGGSCVISGDHGISTTFILEGDAVLVWSTTGTLGGAPVLADECRFDCSQDMRGKVISNPIEVSSADVQIVDPFQTISNLRIDANYTGVTVNGADIGTNVRLTRGTPA